MDEFDMNDAANSITVDIGDTADEITSFEDTYKEFVEGVAEWKLDVDSFWDGAVDFLDEEGQLFIGNSPVLISAFPDGDAEGKSGYAGNSIMVSRSPVSPIGGASTMSLSFQGTAPISLVLVVRKAVIAASGANNGPARDYGSAGSVGNVPTAFLHVTAYSGFSSVAVKVQMDTGSGFGTPTDIITFASVTGVTSERKAATVVGEQFLRVVVTPVGSGSITLVVGADNP